MSHSQMIINYVPGDECRVAIVEDGKLEELNSERFSAASRVGNIYVGRVMNVEPSIQAAFIDFGVEENGFLHYSDLHPRYFPGEDVEETTERVGHKTPRRERPPIQQCLRRGQEITVQVLKEGVGTKGPTLTSYLSIPGRFLVMMPQMDKVGVSRKVEDEEQRAKMREILDQLDLPDGFGFILRTAGLDRTKAELKRDLAYLQRLWKDMERRLEIGSGKPRLLCSESDLLVRSLRDQLTADVNEVVIDNEVALQRASRFMKIVAPRSQTKLLHYPGKTPIFHAFGIEQQIATIHAREVSLPGGGRLVIDQTEALVAIDVNSGKMRDSKDAETNAYRTNLEAVDEICRQLRLRDMGGIIVNDLIDMRFANHRKDVETRFKERLKRDKARTTTAPISLFGILEMTRQRMRGSHESVHFVDCPTCHGRGLVQRPDSVAADALRELAAILDAERVARVELVVAPRVAGELLSSKRQLLGRIERASGKHVDVRVSEATALDRVTFYAYDQSNADLDVTNLPIARKVKELIEWQPEPSGEADQWADTGSEATEVEPEEPLAAELAEPHPIEVDEGALPEDSETQTQGENDEQRGGRRKRRRRRGRGRARGEGSQEGEGRPASGSDARRSAPEPSRGDDAPSTDNQSAGMPGDEPDSAFEPASNEDARQGQAQDHGQDQGQGGPDDRPALGPDGQPRKRRRRRRRRGGGNPTGAPNGAPALGESDDLAPRSPNDDSPSMATGGMMTPQAFGQPQQPRNDSDQSSRQQGGYRNVRRARGATGPQGSPSPGQSRPDNDSPELNSDRAADRQAGVLTGDQHEQPLGERAFDEGHEAGNGQGPEADNNQGGEGQRGGRRRRRRGGRGGKGGGQGAPQSNPQNGPQTRAPVGPPQPRNERRDAAPPPVAAPPPPQAPAAPKPKLLYSTRRRLMPSELNKRPKPE